MRLFSTIAYHSTSQKGLKKFEDFTSKEKAYKGEGAQVHGWGLYLQEDKWINIERYKERLGMIRFKVTIDGTEWESNDIPTSNKEFDITDASFENQNGDAPDTTTLDILEVICVNGGVNEGIERLKEIIEDCELSLDGKYRTLQGQLVDIPKPTGDFLQFNLDTVKRYKEELEIMNSHNIQFEKFENDSVQYEVEIPDNFIFLYEDEPIENQISNLSEVMNKYNFVTSDEYKAEENKIEEGLKKKYPQVNPQIFKKIKENYVEYAKPNLMKNYLSFLFNPSDWGYDKDLEELPDNVDYIIQQALYEFNELSFKKVVRTGRDLYQDLKIMFVDNQMIASKALLKCGIDGISYEGDRDGQCYVIFNCKELKILSENA